MKKLYLVDASSLFFRAFFAIPPLTNKKGMPTNALHGLTSMTIKLLREFKPDFLAYCYDRKEPSFRKTLYQGYKAQREEMPADLAVQMPFVRRMVTALGIPHFEMENYEADDVIGSLCAWGLKNELEVVIVSGDKDFAQLVGPRVTLLDTMKDRQMDAAGVVAKWGIRPEQMIDYLALVGDSSDNIPGVKGIGAKTAEKLLKEYHSLNEIYQRIEEVKPEGVRKKLAEHREMAFLSQRLVTIVKDLNLVESPEELKLREFDLPAIETLMDELNFNSLKTKLLNDPSEKDHLRAEKKPIKPAKSRSEVTFHQWESSEVARNIVPYSEVWLFKVGEDYGLASQNQVFVVQPHQFEAFSRWAFGKHLKFKGFDLKSCWHELNLTDPLVSEDLMLAHYAATSEPVKDLEQLLSYYQIEEDIVGNDWDQRLEVHQILEAAIRKLLIERDSERVYREIDLPLAPVLYEMEKEGVGLDKDWLSFQSQELAQDLQRIENEIFQQAGESFNVLSPKQLGVILFEKLGLEKGKKTKTGYSTNSEVLEKLRNQHAIVPMIIEYRELSKLKSTYVDSLPLLVDEKTNRIHTDFRQALTATGRLSSANPNLQNIPIRTERGRLVRKAFVPAKGKKFLVVDYSQIELRILAHLSGDEAMIRAFREDQDIHQATASEIFETPLTEVSSEMRRQAKAVNFGISYGQGAFGLAETLNIGRKEAQLIIDRYFDRFPGIKVYMQNAIASAVEQGFVETLFGRRRYMTELKSQNQAVRKFGERAAINAPIQGTASDLVKMAMIQLRDEVPIPMVLQVHDELIFEGKSEDLLEEQERIRTIMENVASLKVPLKVNLMIGSTWTH